MPAKRGKRWAAYAYNPATKGKRYVGTYDTRREAKQAQDRYRDRHRRLRRQETCGSFARRWPDDYPRKRESTNRHNRERISKFADDFDHLQLADLDRPTARRWALDNPSRAEVARAMFTDAMNDGLVEHNPFSNLRLPHGKGRRGIVALTEQELGRLADGAVTVYGELLGSELRALILWCGYTAMGPAETFALEWRDLRGDLVDLRRQKVEVERPVIVPPPARVALDRMPRHDRALVFASPLGRKWTNASWRRYWVEVRAAFTGSLAADHWLPRRIAEGGKPLTMYELRHAAATILLERGVSPWDVSVQLGHIDGGTLVQNLYGHPSEDGARARLLAAYGVEVGASSPPTPIRRKRESREAAG